MITKLLALLAKLFKKWEENEITDFSTPISTDGGTVLPPKPPQEETLLWDTPQHAYRSVRVICDNIGLPLVKNTIVNGVAYYPKDILCACVYQESQFKNTAVGKNASSTDWGIAQVNDTPGWHIGPGLRFSSIKDVLDHPEQAVAWMATVLKTTGALQPWASYTSKAYQQWLRASSPMWKLKAV